MKKRQQFWYFIPVKTQNWRPEMKGWKMYSKIHQLNEDGLNKAQVARKLSYCQKLWNGIRNDVSQITSIKRRYLPQTHHP